MKKYVFYTLFDVNYLDRGLALIKSIQKFCTVDYAIVVLCLDQAAKQALDGLALPQLTALRLDDLGDRELMSLHGVRPHREFR
jgi:hypothetical protein